MKINVNLYGGKGIFGGKETPLEADEIYCEIYDQCTFYKENKCLRCRNFLAPSCQFGQNSTIKGYTSRAKKYYDFKNKYQNDDVYGKLKYPTKLVAVIGEYLYLNLKFTLVRKKQKEKSFSRCYRCVDGYEITEVGFSNGSCFIPLTDITNNLLYGIFSYNPQAMMGGTIVDYQKKVVPEILHELKTVAPKIYKSFVAEYPEYDITPNYVGKRAYVYSLKPGTTFRYKGYDWLFDGEYLSAKNFDIGVNSPWWLEGCKYSDIKIKVNNKMLFEINDNSIVDEETKFE